MRPLVPLALALADVLAVVLITLLAIYLRRTVFPELFGLDPFSPVRNYVTLWPVLVLLVLIRGVFGLYPGYGLHPAEELRRQTLASVTLIFFVLAGSALFQFSSVYSRTVLGFAGLLILLLLPLARAALKQLLSRLPFYGSPIWVIGDSERADAFAQALRCDAALGFRVVGQSKDVPPGNGGLHYCLLVPDGYESVPLATLLDQLNTRFRHVWLAPNLLDVASVWVTPRDVQGHLALELRNNLLEPTNRVVKRSLDIVLVLLLMPLLIPLCLLLAVWILLDSRGPVLFGQQRVGRDGKLFTAWKFRTMMPDAERALAEHLSAHPEAEAEWRELRKLRDDPRVTRPGRLLRRLSLDELPQVWNVVRGEMSLVGPRPIMPDELEWYAGNSHLYTRVRPGITGLWQVSGRNLLSYDERVRLDTYYVRNWSVWLDWVIIGRTLWTVISRDGAY